jgi:hypothetical protein
VHRQDSATDVQCCQPAPRNEVKQTGSQAGGRVSMPAAEAASSVRTQDVSPCTSLHCTVPALSVQQVKTSADPCTLISPATPHADAECSSGGDSAALATRSGGNPTALAAPKCSGRMHHPRRRECATPGAAPPQMHQPHCPSPGRHVTVCMHTGLAPSMRCPSRRPFPTPAIPPGTPSSCCYA